ncbi:hemerythrin domain-containing protein [uncultured Endozoicomonas sp.]|uniref:hemerythrin domain-containing protein n=1 Tax=uncultured Endozoicomonas sp. TaxID=432652 RepID=UPI002615FF71|nr:hemerythrin domain-containing protein [uncultured Endozoicomonas sp.]
MTVIEQIIKDHQHMTRLLDFLDQEVSRYRDDNEYAPRINLILEALDYLHHYPDAFHHPIESRLMVRLRPRLERQNDRIQFDLIENQHQQITAMTQKLNAAFSSVAKDQVVPINLLLSEYVLYSELQREHMELENQYMIPAMQALLSEDDLAQVQDDLKQMADPLFGAHLWEMYENLYQHIAESELMPDVI